MSKEPQLAIALQFLNAFDEESIYTFQTFDDSKTLKRPYLARILHGNLQDRSSELIHLNNQGAGIFFTVNVTDGKGRSASNIIKIRAVFVDLDGAPLEPILKSPLEPHFIIQSSPNKYHVYWLVEGISIEKFTSIQKFLAAYFQGDEKVCDTARVMRLPGFLHHKGKPYLTHVIQSSPHLPYQVEQLISAFKIDMRNSEEDSPHLGVEHDLILQALQTRKMLRHSIHGKPGGWEIICPWATFHTTGNTGTHYFEPYTNGYKGAGFHCFHTHCQNKSIEDLKNWLGLEQIKLSEEWDEPIPLQEGLPSVAEFDEEMLPEPLRPWIMDIADRMQIPPDFSAAALVVILGSLIGRTLGIYPKEKDNWVVAPNLWGAVIGRPSLMKSPAIREVMKPLERLVIESIQSYEQAQLEFEKHKLIAEARKSALKDNLKQAAKKKGANLEGVFNEQQELSLPEEPILKRYKTEDGTVEKIGEILLNHPRGILIHRDELMGWLTSLDRYGREGDRAFYLEAWNGTGSFTVDRIGRGTLHIPALCLSLLGGIQPGPLSNYVFQSVSGGFGDDGLLQRFQLTVWPDAPPTWKNVDRWPDTKAKTQAYEIFQRLDQLKPPAHLYVEEGEIPAIHFSAEGQEIFNEWRINLEQELRKGTLIPALESHLAKYRSLMPSLALIFQLTLTVNNRENISCVQASEAIRAASWCEYLESHAKRLYFSVETPAMQSARVLLERIKKEDVTDHFSPRDIYRKCWSHLTSPDMVHQAIKILIEFGWLKEKISQENKSKMLSIHPKLRRVYEL